LANQVRWGIRLSEANHEDNTPSSECGSLANHWPKEYGGTAWNAAQTFIFDTECALANAPCVTQAER